MLFYIHLSYIYMIIYTYISIHISYMCVTSIDGWTDGLGVVFWGAKVTIEVQRPRTMELWNHPWAKQDLYSRDVPCLLSKCSGFRVDGAILKFVCFFFFKWASIDNTFWGLCHLSNPCRYLYQIPRFNLLEGSDSRPVPPARDKASHGFVPVPATVGKMERPATIWVFGT